MRFILRSLAICSIDIALLIYIIIYRIEHGSASLLIIATMILALYSLVMEFPKLIYKIKRYAVALKQTK